LDPQCTKTDTSLKNSIDKQTDSDLQREVASLHIREKTADSLTVYTDGSKGEKGQLGIGIFIPKWKVATNFGVPEGASIFTAELAAINKALEIVAQNPPKKVTIFTDSLSSVAALEATSKSEAPELVDQILTTITELIKKIRGYTRK
jgi:transposase-like protein